MGKPEIINFVEHSRSGQSGVQTFLDSFNLLGEQADIEYKEIVLPSMENSERHQQTSPASEATKVTGGEIRKIWDGARLLLGYIRLVKADIRRLRKVAAEAKAHRNAILLAQDFGCETLPLAMRILFPHRRIVSIAHTLPGMDASARHPIRRVLERLCYRAVSDIIFNSHALKAEWGKKLGRKKMKGVVILHGLRAPSVKNPPDYPFKKKGMIDFVCVARFVEMKGQRELLQAWRQVIGKATRPVRLIFVGNGPSFDAMRKLAADLSLNETVIFMGFQEQGAAYFEPGDVGILLSNEPEAFGLVLLEAMSRNKPVIASRLGGIPEVVESEVTGLLVDPFNADEVMNAILRLAESEKLRRTLGDAGAERWRTHFTVERMLKNYGDYFRGVGLTREMT